MASGGTLAGCGYLLAIPRVRAMLCGLANIAVGVISSIEITVAGLLKNSHVLEKESESNFQGSDQYYDKDYDTEFSIISTAKPGNLKEKSLDVLLQERTGDLVLILLLLTSGASIYLSTQQSKSKRNHFAILGVSLMVACLLTVGALTGLKGHNKHLNASLAIWGSIIQFIFLWNVFVYLYHPEEEPLSMEQSENYEDQGNCCLCSVCACCLIFDECLDSD